MKLNRILLDYGLSIYGEDKEVLFSSFPSYSSLLLFGVQPLMFLSEVLNLNNKIAQESMDRAFFVPFSGIGLTGMNRQNKNKYFSHSNHKQNKVRPS